MKRMIQILPYAMLAAVLCAIAACGNNSGGNTSPGATTVTLTVIVTENAGKGLPGFEVTTEPATTTVFTDSLGHAVLNDLPFGTYSVRISQEGYPQVYAGANLSNGSGSVTVSYLPTATIQFKHETKGPYAGAQITTEPYGFSGRTDNQGCVTFTRMPVTYYTFTVRREGLPDITFSSTTPSLSTTLFVPNHIPTVVITSPADKSTFTSTRPVTFTGSGTDIEDGAIPDSSLVWYSDRDGEIGRGAKLVVSSLSGGNHRITLKGFDADDKPGEASVGIGVADLQLDSYFPIPLGETWSYSFLVPEFYVSTGDSTYEYWVMKDVSVKIYDGNLRSVTMVYDIVKNGAMLHYSYTVNDVFQSDGTGLAISKTDETSLEWDTGTPYKTLLVNTTYTPPYILLKNAKSISPQSSFSFKTDLMVSWYSVSYGSRSNTYTEYETLSVLSKAFDEETITTSAGTFPAICVVTNERGIEKTVWFAKGVGPVKFEDNSFSPKATATLTNASLLRIGLTAKSAFHPSGTKAAAPILHIDRNTPQGMRELHRFLSSMAPR